MSNSLIESYVRLFLERRARQVILSGDRTADWGSSDHISDLEQRLADAEYWRNKLPRGSEKRSHYRNVCSHLKRELQSAKKKLQINEGGLVGHLMHLYDNRDLTFREIKTILKKASSGRLESVSEKMDGMNLVFTYDFPSKKVLVARNRGDIIGGGVDAAAIAAKFSGRASVEEAFNSALKVLQGAIDSLPAKVQTRVFGSAANRWYSMEIIYSKNPNVINYDSDSVVFHGWPVFKRDKSGNAVQTEDEVGGIEILTSYIDEMQNAITATGWKVRGPSIMRMKAIANGSILDEVLSRIDEATAQAGTKDSHTVGKYLENLMKQSVNQLGLDASVSKDVINRCLEVEGAPTLTAIKKKLEKSQIEQVSAFVKNSPALIKSFISPIELAINDFAIEILKGLKSTLIDDSDKEVLRLRDELSSAISAIEASGDETAMSILSQQMAKLKSVENISSPMEGVVFIFKGNAYKFTGSFAAANQILGLFKYGRGGTKITASPKSRE